VSKLVVHRGRGFVGTNSKTCDRRQIGPGKVGSATVWATSAQEDRLSRSSDVSLQNFKFLLVSELEMFGHERMNLYRLVIFPSFAVTALACNHNTNQGELSSRRHFLNS
jgi:hypothetical protein